MDYGIQSTLPAAQLLGISMIVGVIHVVPPGHGSDVKRDYGGISGGLTIRLL